MKRVLILFILLLLPSAYAEVDNYNNVSILTTHVVVASSLERTSGTVSQISTILNFFPKEYDYQSLLSQNFPSSPDAEIEQKEDEVSFVWQQTSSLYTFSIDSTVQTENNFVEISEKIPYPALISEEVQVYTIPTDIIDITPDIDSLAEDIVGGEDDLYKVVFLLANWTQVNIAYNLSTLNVEANEKSSYVLEHKEGVCDELTNLFISLARSRGIPARFVSGIVYSNQGYTFGAHGWAEVYIDGKWIPVDVTFGTFGWVDPSHIKFKEELGSNSASLFYSATGNGLDVALGKMSIDAEIIRAQGVGQKYVSLEVLPLEDHVGQGSYVPIQILVSNNNSFYVPVKLSLSKAPGIVGANTKSVLLAPGEEKSVFWILSVPENINPLYEYVSLIEVQSMYGEVAETNLTYSAHYPPISEEDAELDIANLIVDENKDYLNEVSLSCSLDKESYYQNDTATLSCSLDGDLEDAEVCFKEDCSSAASQLVWILDLEGQNSERLFVRAEKGGKARYSYFNLAILKNPNLRIENFEPQSMNFTDSATLAFDLVTDSPVQNISIHIDPLGNFALSSLEVKEHITSPIEGKDVYKEEVTFTLDYTDILGTPYHTEYTESISVENIPWYYQILSLVLSLFH
ncbi:hypothetical protein EXS74_00835 [Candidatus Woesearchaeota archaeon]|nr:hypothetical protein [Candidatus Woesearchaeota archaeon]